MSTGQSQQFCVRWNSHLGSLGAAFPQLLAGQRFVDVTLACEGHQVHCHRLVLAACSTYFENLLGENPCQHPIIILPRDIKLWAIQALVDFMYKGEVNVSQAGLPDLMKCAEILKIRGLCGSDALNLNQIHSPTESYQQQHGAGSDSGNTSASTKPSDSSPASATQTGGAFQPQFDQHSRSQQNSSSSGPKGQLLSSLHLRPVVMRGHHHQQQQHHQDEGNTSDNGGDSGNEICIKTEDLMIDEDTNSKQCDEDDEREDNDGSDKMPADALLHVHPGLDVEDAVDDQNRREALQVPEQELMEEEEEEEEDRVSKQNRLIMERLDGRQSSEQQHEPMPDYEQYAAGSEGQEDDEDDDVLVVREETEGTPATKDGAAVGKQEEARRKRRRHSTSNHSENNNELSIVGATAPSECGAGAKVNATIRQTEAGDPRRTNGARSNQAVPSLNSLTGSKSFGSSAGGSIRVKSIENLFANYHTKQSPKSSRDKRRAALLVGSSEGNNSENESASEHANGVPSSLVYNRNEMDIYVTPQKHQKRFGPEQDSNGGETGSAVTEEEGDGYENIICSPNFPQLTGVVGGYKAEDEDEEEDYGDDYAIQLLAEEIDSSMLGNGGGDSEGDEILYKPPPLMAIDGKVSAKSASMRTYGRNTVGGGHGTSSTLTIRKIERQARGSGPQSNSLTRSTRRPRLMAHSKEGGLHQLIKSNGTPPPIAFTLRNPRGNQPRTYNTEALWAALMDVKAGESIYRASQMHKVPRKTLRNWMKRWDIKSAYPMPRQLKEAAEKKRIIKELTTQIQ
ncbi:protein tramtrack, beta isoform-like [Anopheles ziemanni]|uniref:protein tramtrack, beta isoform-like n=1 Tax=Anopheles coustani TaxID=139045 RepID=UPI002657D013|nr:protein tramtrack, beta isoform-like [Anopheles coustani]XP_058169572.1 protein tramtrack, beta isoform-like [Anopheles ziemanni]